MDTVGLKKFRPKKGRLLNFGVYLAAFAVTGGIIALIIARAAPSINIVSSLPQPKNVRAFADDRTLTVVWDKVNDPNIVGYYLTYKKKGAANPENVRQTIYNSIQLQPLENGQEYEISVHSAEGTYQYTPIGPLAHSDSGGLNKWARGNGNVSAPSVTTGTPSDARVNAQRSRLTGFFDDFNTPSNPFDELKWNNAATSCNMPLGTAAFLNAQYHSHNMAKSQYCDRSGQVIRPRAVFDTTGRSESKPAMIEMDIDGVHDARDTWYLDIIPTDARKDGTPLDVTSHADMFHGDTSDPGNMLRMNISGKNKLHFVYYDENRRSVDLPMVSSNTACGAGRESGTETRFTSCDMRQKTPGISPTPQSDNNAAPIPNVRRHWAIRMTENKIKLYIDSVLVGEATLPPAFAAKTKFHLHSTLFTYNTGKGFNPDNGHGMSTSPVMQMLHWDNFGFSGPAPDYVTHNYIEGGTDGRTPNYLSTYGTGAIPRGNRTTTVPIPDDLGSPINNQAKLFFTLGQTSSHTYRWAAGDHVLVNGRRYNVPNPAEFTNTTDSNALRVTNGQNMSYSIPISRNDLIKGTNNITFNLGSTASINNVHIELYYSKSGNIPNYTQPIQIYRQALSNIAEPAMTNCDTYNTIEQDLGLPYLNGKQNLQIGECFFLHTMASHNPDYYGPHEQLPNPDVTPPSVHISSPANNTTINSDSITVRANASDNVAVSAVEFYLGGSLISTDTSSPYEANMSFVGVAPGNYAVHAIARDSSGNETVSSSINVIKPVPQDTTAPTVSISSPANNTTLAQNTTTLNVSANASDAVGVVRVDFYLDNVLYASDSSSPYSTSIQVGALQPGSHSLYAVARDAAGNTRQSSTVNFLVPNPPPATCPAGQTGTPPNCVVPPPPSCPEGQTGTPPNCKVPEPDPEPNPNPGIKGDLNGSGGVDISDLLILLANYAKTVPANTGGDLNGDGRVNILDLSILLSNFGK